MAQEAVWLSGLVSYEQSEAILQRIGQIDISDSSVWRQAQKWGKKFKDIEDKERVTANTVANGRDGQRREVKSEGRKGVSMDGGMVYIRGEGWKEVKVGAVFEVDVQPTTDPLTGDVIDLAHAVKVSYTAHLGGPEVFGAQLWAEAKRRGWEKALDTEAIGDAAAWIWNIVAGCFYDSHQVVDWYHATEHLAAVAHLLKGEGTPAAAHWLNEYKRTLFQGQIDQLVQDIHKAAQDQPDQTEEIQKQTGYFENNKKRMNYQEMRENGFVIGSGTVESGAKQYKARLCGPGMRWSRSGAENLLPIRSAIMSHRFDAWWQRAYNSPPA